MAATQIVKTATGTAISVNGIIIDPSGAANTNVLVFDSGTNTFKPGAGGGGGGSTGNWTFSLNNADLTAAGTMGIGLTTATAITIGGGTAAASTNGGDTSIRSQAGGTGTTNGGNILLNLGAPAGTGTYGAVQVQTNGTLRGRLFYDTTTGGIRIEGDSTTSFLRLSNGLGTVIGNGNASSQWASNYIAMNAGAPTGAGPGHSAGIIISANLSYTTSGNTLFSISEPNSAGDLTVKGVISLTSHSDGLGEGFDLVADTAGTTANAVCVFTGAKKVATAAATANLLTWAGVSVLAATSGNRARVINYGRVYVNYTGTVAAGDLLTTSATTAGSVAANNAATGRQIIGVAMEAGGATVAGLVQMMMG